jgi:Flp pilus assembly pilin Flp
MTSNRRRSIDLTDDRGQSLTEYSLLITLIAVAVAVALPGLASAVSSLFTGFVAAVGG